MGGEHLLEVGRQDLIGDRFAVDRVDAVRVRDLVGPVRGRVEVETLGGGDFALAHAVAHGVRVEGGFFHREGFVGDEGVAVAVDGRVDAQAEDVLVVDGQHARVDDGAPGDGDAFVDGLGGEDAGGADLVGQFAGLVEDEGEDVFVVGDGDDGLQDELAGARDGRQVGAVVGVFPADAGVLLVHAHDVLHRQGLALVIRNESRDVVDAAQTVAAQSEVVGHDAGTGVAQVKGGFAMEGGSGIAVRDVHVGESQAIEEGAIVVADIVEDHAFTLVEAVAEGPFLPVDDLTRLSGWRDREAGSLRLNDIERLEIRSQLLVLGRILVTLGKVDGAQRFDL